jgi:predicted ATPase
LLTEEERLLFDRVSVFAGGFDLQAGEKVCGFDPIDVLDSFDLVSSLVDKSMIVADRGASGMRYRLLETLRQYGEEQMELRGETHSVRDRHAAYYADLVSGLDVLVRGERQPRLPNACRSSGTICALLTCGRSLRRILTSPSGYQRHLGSRPLS